MTMRTDANAMSAEMNVTPMIDVMLVLLIIFMLTFPKRRVVDLQLPIPGPAFLDASRSIVLEVLPGRAFYLNRSFVDEPQLGARLRDVYDNRPDKVLFVAGSPAVRYQDVITAIDSARGAGVRVIGIPPRARP
jgi:biopolymer transport protein TolR